MVEKTLTHLNARGEAHMVDVSEKEISDRVAIAEGFVEMKPGTLELILAGHSLKGDVLATARIAGIMAAKRTHDLIPLCHPLAITKAEVSFEPCPQKGERAQLRVEAMVKVSGKTGVEMEALTAVSIACLTLYDMVKAVDKGIIFSAIRLIEKSGGRSGPFRLPQEEVSRRGSP